MTSRERTLALLLGAALWGSASSIPWQARQRLGQTRRRLCPEQRLIGLKQ